MFEKEAEEWANKNKTGGGSSSFGDITNYHDLREGFIVGAKFGYKKATEWHYVKDGDLPKHEVNVLVFVNKQCIDIAHYNYDFKEWHFADTIGYDVIAWKEIVLPELPKESE